MFAEATVIPGTITYFKCIRLNMKILAVLVITFTKLLKEVANWHLCHVIFVQEFAIIAFLAEMSQPVLTDNGTLTTNMAEGTVATSTTCPIHKELTHR